MMTEKVARANIRKALALFRNRIKFPRIRIKDLLESEDIRAIFKEFVSNRLQKRISGS